MSQNLSNCLQRKYWRKINGKNILCLMIFVIFVFVLHWCQVILTPNLTTKYFIKSDNSSQVHTLYTVTNVSVSRPLEKKPEKLSERTENLKYILLWTSKTLAPLSFLGEKQNKFILKNCSVTNCYVTDDRNFFGGDLTKFHAVAFNGRNMMKEDLPKQRSPHQKYIYFNMESADIYPVCDKEFDNFFNWTATYKLDSDIPFGYIQIKDAIGNVIGPKKEMKWQTDYPEIDEDVAIKLGNKSLVAAWFVSHCSTRSKRELYTIELNKKLRTYNCNVDIYGTCGPLSCPRNRSIDCYRKLENDYYFYLSFENSFAVDYVTEKLLNALKHNVVPIVYGGADYTRFLPPGSYLDARKMDASALAATMIKTMSSPELYQSYFRWKGFYEYSDPTVNENVCGVCAALNDKERFEKYSLRKEFRKWWYPKYKSKSC